MGQRDAVIEMRSRHGRIAAMGNDVEAFERATRRSRQIKLGLLALLIASPFLYLGYTCQVKKNKIAAAREEYEAAQRLSAAEVSELRALIPKTRTAIADATKAFTEVVTHEKLAAIIPGESRCPHRFSAPDLRSGQSYVEHGSIDGNYFGSMSYQLLEPGAPIKPAGLGDATTALDRADEALRKNAPTKSILEDVRGASDLGTTLIIVGKRTEPIVMAGVVDASYIPGEIRGTVFLYSFASRQIECAAFLAVQNSSAVDIRYSYSAGNYSDKDRNLSEAGRGALQRDLEVELRRAIAQGLRVVGP